MLHQPRHSSERHLHGSAHQPLHLLGGETWSAGEHQHLVVGGVGKGVELEERAHQAPHHHQRQRVAVGADQDVLAVVECEPAGFEVGCTRLAIGARQRPLQSQLSAVVPLLDAAVSACSLSPGIATLDAVRQDRRADRVAGSRVAVGIGADQRAAVLVGGVERADDHLRSLLAEANAQPEAAALVEVAFETHALTGEALLHERDELTRLRDGTIAGAGVVTPFST